MTRAQFSLRALASLAGIAISGCSETSTEPTAQAPSQPEPAPQALAGWTPQADYEVITVRRTATGYQFNSAWVDSNHVPVNRQWSV